MIDPQISFSAGVIDPAMHARVDSQVYAQGLKTATNALVIPQGGVWNRPGTKYLTDVTIAGSEDEAKCIPFVFSVDQSYMLIFVEGRMYVYKDGGMVQSGGNDYYLSTGLTSADLSEIRYAQVADELYLTSHDFTPKKIIRTADDNWSIASVTFGSYRLANGELPFDHLVGYSFDYGPIDAGRAYSGAPSEDDPGQIGINVKYIVRLVYNGVEYAYNDAEELDAPVSSVYPVTYEDLAAVTWVTWSYLAGAGSHWVLSTGATYGGWYYYNQNKTAQMAGQDWHPDNITRITSFPTTSAGVGIQSMKELPSGVNSALPVANYWAFDDVDSLGFDTVYVNLGGTNPNLIDDYYLLQYADFVYNVYASVGNTGQYGLVESTSFPYLDRTAEWSPNYNIQPFTDNIPFDSADSVTYPLAVCFQAQRAWYGGATDTPNQVNASRTSSLDSFGYHVPLQDDDAIEATIASTQVNGIRHMVPRDDYVLVFTDGACWRMYGVGGPFTPTTTAFDRICDAFIGSAPPLQVGERLLYTDRLGRVFELARGDNLVEEPVDISLRAQHLFRGYTIVSWCYQNAPERTLWAVRSDGKVLSCTIVPEFNVWAWTLHEFGGTDTVVLSVGSIKVGTRDKVVFTVQRTINGATKVYAEELQDRYITTRNDSWFLDSALDYTGGGISNPSGLDHLEGESVYALADGTTLGPFTVTSGAIALGGTYSDVVVGLRYTTTVQTLTVNSPEGGLLGVYTDVVNVRTRVRDSMVFKCGPDSTNVYDIDLTTYDYDSTTNLATTVVVTSLSGDWRRDGGVTFTNSNPTPMTLDAVIPEFATEEPTNA